MPTANFGLRSRNKNSNNKQYASANPWTHTKNNNKSGSTTNTNSQDIRSQISNKYITYCTFALGYDRKKPPPSKPQLVRHILSILRHGDGKLGFLPYDKTSKANALCHAVSVPNSPEELAQYFPDFTHYLRRFRTKCRITSELPMWQIKSKVFPELRANDFWMNPTSLKCQTSEKCGFFLYAHHFITQQSDFRALLDPILEKEWGKNEDFEYDFQAETLTVTIQGDKVFSKVFIIRSNPKFTSKLQQTLSRMYAADSNVNLLTLGRYKFIPLTSNAVVSDEMLQGLLRSQNAYSKNVFVYVCHNISTIEHTFNIQDLESQEAAPDIEENSSPGAKQSSSYQYSLREWLYDLEDDDGTPLIHAAYIMPASTTIKILCERSKRFRVLQLLHELQDHVQQFFPPEAISKYFPNSQSHPFEVEKFPTVSQQCGTYANELAAFAMGNPQDESVDPVPATPVNDNGKSATKRTRQGEPIKVTHTPQTTTQLLEQLDENQRKLTELNEENTTRDNALHKLAESLKDLDKRVENNDSAINKIAQSQLAQGNLITNINHKQKFLESHLTKLCTHFGLPVEQAPPLDNNEQNQSILKNSPPEPNPEDEIMRDVEHDESMMPPTDEYENETQENNNNITQDMMPDVPHGQQGAQES